MFLGLNKLRIFRTGKGKRVTELNDKEFEKTIRDWLDDPLFKFQRKDDPKYLFMFVVTDEQGRPITISRKISKPAQLHLATAITLGKEHIKTYETLSYYEKEKILYNLRIEMARYGIGYSGIEMELKRVVLTDTVLLDDSLTEFYLKQRIFYVTGAFILYGQRISQQLMSSGEQEMHKEDSQS